MKYFISVSLVTLILFSCKKDDEKTDPVPVDPIPATISFASDVHPIFLTNCNGSYCYGGGADGKNYDDYAGVTAVPSATILGAINHSTGYVPMPDSQPKLSQGKIDTIAAWINEGSLNN